MLNVLALGFAIYPVSVSSQVDPDQPISALSCRDTLVCRSTVDQSPSHNAKQRWREVRSTAPQRKQGRQTVSPRQPSRDVLFPTHRTVRYSTKMQYKITQQWYNIVVVHACTVHCTVRTVLSVLVEQTRLRTDMDVSFPTKQFVCEWPSLFQRSVQAK